MRVLKRSPQAAGTDHDDFPPTRSLILPSELRWAYDENPIGVMQVLLDVLEKEEPFLAHRAFTYATGLDIHPVVAAPYAYLDPKEYDQPDEDGETMRAFNAELLKDSIAHLRGHSGPSWFD